MRKAVIFAKLQFPIFFGFILGRIFYPHTFSPIASFIFHTLLINTLFCLCRGIWSICKYNAWERNQKETLKSIVNQEKETIKHLIFIPMYKEDVQVAYETLNHMKNYKNKFDFTICLATEARDPTAPAKVIELKESFKGCFTDIISTCHPDNLTKSEEKDLM